jgi:hypothetical protein
MQIYEIRRSSISAGNCSWILTCLPRSLKAFLRTSSNSRRYINLAIIGRAPINEMVNHPPQTQDRTGKHSVENRDNTGYRDAIMTPPNNNQNSGKRPYKRQRAVIIRNITSVTICVVQTSRTCMFSSAFLCRRVPRAWPCTLQMIRKYDIICLVETKTDDIDIVKLEGYEIHMKNRKIVAVIFWRKEEIVFVCRSSVKVSN